MDALRAWSILTEIGQSAGANMDMRQLRDFVAVVRSSSFAAASRNLRVSQPGLGYQVKQLEDELQVRLLQRHARGVSLTQAGETFMDHAVSILAAVENAKRAMTTLTDNHRKIRIGLAPSLQALGPVLLSSLHPDSSRIQLREAYAPELHQELLDGKLDFAICLIAGRAPLLTVPIYSEPLYVIGPKPDVPSLGKTISISQLAGLPLVLGCRARTPRRLLDETAAVAGIALNVDQEVESQALLRSLVLHSGRHTVAPYGAFAGEIQSGALAARRIIDPEVRQLVNMVYPANLPKCLEKLMGKLTQVILNEGAAAPNLINMASLAAE